MVPSENGSIERAKETNGQLGKSRATTANMSGWTALPDLALILVPTACLATLGSLHGALLSGTS
jgi:hypothetical protein